MKKFMMIVGYFSAFLILGCGPEPSLSSPLERIASAKMQMEVAKKEIKMGAINLEPDLQTDFMLCFILVEDCSRSYNEEIKQADTLFLKNMQRLDLWRRANPDRKILNIQSCDIVLCDATCLKNRVVVYLVDPLPETDQK